MNFKNIREVASNLQSWLPVADSIGSNLNIDISRLASSLRSAKGVLDQTRILRQYTGWSTCNQHARSRLLMRDLPLLIRRGKILFSTKIMVTPTVTMSQLGEAVVSDGPAKSWAIGSAGSAPSSSRVRTPFRQYN